MVKFAFQQHRGPFNYLSLNYPKGVLSETQYRGNSISATTVTHTMGWEYATHFNPCTCDVYCLLEIFVSEKHNPLVTSIFFYWVVRRYKMNLVFSLFFLSQLPLYQSSTYIQTAQDVALLCKSPTQISFLIKKKLLSIQGEETVSL